MSCLARQAKILREEAEEDDLDNDEFISRWERWHTCSLCEQPYHGVVVCALGWACWKTYVGRPEADGPRCHAMTRLGHGLFEANHHEDALSVFEASLDAERRSSNSEQDILCIRIHIARCYTKLQRLDEAVAIEREVYARQKALPGPTDGNTLITGLNLIYSLTLIKHYAEAKTLGRELIPRSRRALGSEDDVTLAIKENYAAVLYSDPTASRRDVAEAISVLEDSLSIRRRVLGTHHPYTLTALAYLECARMTSEDVAA